MRLTLSSASSQSWGIYKYGKILEEKNNTETILVSTFPATGDQSLNGGSSISYKHCLILMTSRNYNGVIAVQAYKNGVGEPLRIWSQTVSAPLRT